MAQDARAKVLALIELAVGEGTPKHEAMAAAMAACKRIKADGLLNKPAVMGKSETVAAPSRYTKPAARKAVWEADDLKGEQDTVTLKISLLVMNETSDVWRVAKLDPPKRSSSQVVLIPKVFVRDVVMMTSSESRAIGWKDSRIIKQISVARSYFATAQQNGWDAYQ